MPRLRYQPPERLLGAADFSSSPELRGSLNSVRLVKSQKWIWDGLRQACDLEVKYARHRTPGHWELVAVAFVTSGHVDVQPWWDSTYDELWSECGFEQRPSYSTTWRRLSELEQVCSEFLDSAALVIKRCRMHDPRVMAHTHIDWTEDETHSDLIHDCKPGEKCKHQNARARRMSTEAAREGRQAMNTRAPEEATEVEKAATPEKTKKVIRKGRARKRIRMNGCWYVTRDFEAGIRSYTGPGGTSKRFWHGFYSGKLTDHYTGGVIPSVDSASINESKLFPRLFDQAVERIGEAPETIVADRGLSIAECFKHATTNGTAPIFPWRAKTKEDKPTDQLAYDRHGVKRCNGCGGPMKQVKFAKGDGKPRLWFHCTLGLTPECKKDQTISCSTDWRYLVPLSQTDPTYHELMESHQSYEAQHDQWRDRYRVASDVLANRPKRVSIGWHRLRANVACLVDWLRIAARCGWLGAKPSKDRHLGTRRFKARAERLVKDLLDERAFLGLMAAYGPAAIKLGFLAAHPPSDRPPPQLA